MSAHDPRSVKSDGERWFLVQAQTGRERLAYEHLVRQGYRCFVPWTWRSVRHARRIRTERCAYFPGYLFVSLDLDRDRWRSIDGTIGVLRLVKAEGRPSAAPRGLVETLMDAAGPDGLLDLSGGGALRAGQGVRIIRGPFADQLATVETMSGTDRVRVLLSIMNQTVPLALSRQDLALMRP